MTVVQLPGWDSSVPFACSMAPITMAMASSGAGGRAHRSPQDLPCVAVFLSVWDFEPPERNWVESRRSECVLAVLLRFVCYRARSQVTQKSSKFGSFEIL